MVGLRVSVTNVQTMQTMLAYIDPASGTLLLQALIAAGIGGIAFFRRSIWGFLSVFSGRSSAKDSSAPDGADDETADPTP
jgi:hypothetical protein